MQHVPAFGPDPLTPISYLIRSEGAFGDHVAVIEGDRRFTYRELAERCRRLAGVLSEAGVRDGKRVSVLAPNTSAMLEAHFGVPMAGGVLNALNTRLNPAEIAYIIDHAGSGVLLVDSELVEVGRAVERALGRSIQTIVCGDAEQDYERRLAAATPLHVPVNDEWDLISLNYTSGTTGRPKGAMYAHRGAFLQALAMATQAGLDNSTVFLWTLPMFHCNGWCFPWAVTAAGGTHVALRRVDPGAIWRALHDEGVTHFNAAPTVLSTLLEHPDARPLSFPVRVATGGAPPSPTLLGRLAALNIEVTHLYGLTETYGPAVICDWQRPWNELDANSRAELKARQGVANIVSRPVRVVDTVGADLPHDGTSAGEVVLRGNVVMLGYYNDDEATNAATVSGPGGAWFRTGDIGVIHPDGYLELRDRAKDIIISGGENIASVEVEQAISSHQAVLECAVVGQPDDQWGEVAVAFVTLRDGATVTESALIDHVKSRIARFKAPKRIYFEGLPKTATGKIQKFLLRERVRRPADEQFS